MATDVATDKTTETLERFARDLEKLSGMTHEASRIVHGAAVTRQSTIRGWRRIVRLRNVVFVVAAVVGLVILMQIVRRAATASDVERPEDERA